MRKEWIRLVITPFLSAACLSTRVPASIPSEPPVLTPAKKQSPETEAQLWEFKFENQTHSYSSVTRTIIESDQKLPANSDTLTTNIDFSITVNRQQASPIFSGQLSRLELITGRRTSIKQQPIKLPLHFTGAITSGQLLLKPALPQPDSTSCDNPENSYLNELHTALISLPMRIQAGSTWTDTLSTITCSGSKIPSTVQIVRTYKVRGNITEASRPFLFIDRAEQIHLSGVGSQDQHQVQVNGEGSGSSAIFLNSDTGTLYRLATSQHLDITLLTSGRSYHFSQKVTQQVDLIL